MNWIENQPVFFGSIDECSDDEIPVQLVDNTDKTQFQFEISPCENAVQIIPDPNFDDPDEWELGEGGWGIAYNLLCRTGSGATFTSDFFEFTIGKYYQVNITVDSISVGGSISVLIGAKEIGVITSVGVHTFYGLCENNASDQYLFLSASESTEICISEITSYEVLTNIIIGIYGSSGNYIDQINYESDPNQFVFSKNTVTIEVDWIALGINNECYYLCLFDPCENTGGQNYSATILNPLFAGNANNWTLSGGAVYFDETIMFQINSSDIYQDAVFNSYINQCINITVTEISGSIQVYFGTEIVGTITTIGVHKICGTPVGNLSVTIATLSGNTATIESVLPITRDELNQVIPYPTDEYVCDLQSNTFKLSDYSNNCTMLINACNNEDGLGFVFDSGFSPKIRLEAKLRQAKYSGERNIYEDSAGKKSVVYFSGRKSKNLCIDLQPEYVHDFLRLLGAFDNLYINNELYAVDDDEYNVEYDESSDSVGKCRILVSKKTQSVKNINCTDEENECTLVGDFLLQEDGSYVLQENSSRISL